MRKTRCGHPCRPTRLRPHTSLHVTIHSSVYTVPISYNWIQKKLFCWFLSFYISW